MWRYGDDEQLLLQRPIDHTEWKAFDKKASGFLERRGSAKGGVAARETAVSTAD